MPNELLRKFEYASYTKYLIFIAFIAGLAFLIFSGQQPGANEEFRHRAFGFRDSDNAALDQPAEKLFAKFPVAPRFRNDVCADRGDKGSATPLQ